MGCAMKANLLAAWRKHFVLEDHMLEVSRKYRGYRTASGVFGQDKNEIFFEKCRYWNAMLILAFTFPQWMPKYASLDCKICSFSTSDVSTELFYFNTLICYLWYGTYFSNLNNKHILQKKLGTFFIFIGTRYLPNKQIIIVILASCLFLKLLVNVRYST